MSKRLYNVSNVWAIYIICRLAITSRVFIKRRRLVMASRNVVLKRPKLHSRCKVNHWSLFDKKILLWNYFRLITIVWSNVGKCIDRTWFSTSFLCLKFWNIHYSSQSPRILPSYPNWQMKQFIIWIRVFYRKLKHSYFLYRR